MKKSILLFSVISCFYSLSNILYAQNPNWIWATRAGGTNNDYASYVTADSSGNIYVAGVFASSTITFGSHSLTNAGLNDIFLVKYDVNGNVLWAKNAGGAGDDEISSVAMDVSGNIYIAGYFESPTITFGSNTLTNVGLNDMFIAKYDANGNVLWAKSAGGTGDDYASSVAVDASGNPYVAGRFYSSTLTFGSTTLTNAGLNDIFLTKYDANGNVLWAKRAGSTGDDEALSVAADASGNTYVTGSFGSSAITFGSTTLTNAGMDDIFLAKYDVNGNVIWAKRAGGNDYDGASSVAVNVSGNIFIAGYFASPTIAFGSTTLTNAGLNDMFLAKYDVNGNVLWAESAGGTDYDGAASVAVDVSGNTYVAGTFASSTISFGSTTLTNAGMDDIFLTKYNVNGNVLWAKSAGGTGGDEPGSVAVDASGNPCLAGWFFSPALTFGSTSLLNADNTGSTDDMFIAKLSDNTGINEIVNQINIAVFPNPSSSLVTIETSEIPTHSTLYIINLNGQTLITCKISGPETTVDITDLPSGVYFLRLTNDKRVEVGKIVKQ